LQAELAMRRHAPDGTVLPPDAYVFGTAVGDRVRSFRRAWESAVFAAHGQTPIRVRGKLTAASQAIYHAIDLHFHDLRREFASRLLETGAAIHDVRELLGHASISTTSRYLQSAPSRLHQAVQRLDAAAFGAEDDADDAATSKPH
jgi:integrase